MAADYGGSRGGDYDYDYDYDQPSQQQQQQQPAGRQSLVKEGHTFEMLPHPNIDKYGMSPLPLNHMDIANLKLLNVERGYCRDW